MVMLKLCRLKNNYSWALCKHTS